MTQPPCGTSIQGERADPNTRHNESKSPRRRLLVGHVQLFTQPPCTHLDCVSGRTRRHDTTRANRPEGGGLDLGWGLPCFQKTQATATTFCTKALGPQWHKQHIKRTDVQLRIMLTRWNNRQNGATMGNISLLTRCFCSSSRLGLLVEQCLGLWPESSDLMLL